MLRLTIISILLSSLGFSQNEEIKIAKVEVDGNEVTSKKTIIFTSGLREGQTITTAVVIVCPSLNPDVKIMVFFEVTSFPSTSTLAILISSF